MKRNLFGRSAPNAIIPLPPGAMVPPQDFDTAQREEDVRLACLDLAVRTFGARGPREVLQTAEVFAAYVRSGAISVGS